MISFEVKPDVPKGSSMEVIAHIRSGRVSTRRAVHYANELRTEIKGGLEVFTGWCNFLANGTRVGALAENEVVDAWELPERVGTVQWVKTPVLPEVPDGEIRQFLISFQQFGSKTTKTMAAYFANRYKSGSVIYHGWVIGHEMWGVYSFVTIGDVIVAWSELPVCDIQE